CFQPESNSLNAVTVKLANAIGACDGSPGIILDPENRCSRQALVCDPSIEPTAFNCPVGHALDPETLTCQRVEGCQQDYSTTGIKDLLIPAYCKYPPLDDGFGRNGRTSTFCQDWFVDCNARQFVFCESGKLFDKKGQFCRPPLPEDRCSLQNCLNWEWMRVPLGQCISEFAFCEGRIPELFRCPHDRVFKDGRCVLQSRVRDCAVCEPGERKPAKHCREYFECRPYQNPDHPWVKISCPDGKFYNRQWKTCEEDNGGACADYRKCEDGESFSPTCGDYLLCLNGKFEFGRCPHLTRWSSEHRSCVPDNDCRRYETNEKTCRPGDVIKTSDCESYYVCDADRGEYVKRSCKDSLYETSGPCDYCRHSQPYKPNGDVANVNCEENS
uniref:Chitin-binding type-2 domain-containing protein n=1 Tax=Panagrolaimus sp. JU765 TaxID=591449 RepID=A0AC34RAP1_9BILA